ncbi:hypothetical protein SKAU_G00261100 [Synaphobranchus kaupii]|uniref:ribonuclease H n=1 Tax=Synaphobranchus kaupii TaxID=118154 RepID=A0A9Q1IPM2_SYNKA|nr:hypothetical protein SKAU_G00261100 [Synaphobranchus kaupii]
MACLCDYGALQEQIIWDQFIEGILCNPPQQLQPTYHAHYSAHSTDDSQCCSEAGIPVQLAQRQSNRRTSEVCRNCGSKSHNARAQHFPARGQKCRNCLKQNHFAKMCCSAPAALPPAMGPPPAHNNYTEIRNVTAGQVAFKTCTVQLAEVTLPLLMDTGAAASLLNSSTYYRFFPHLPLEQPASALCGYDSSRDDAGSAIHHVDSTWRQKWPALFDGLGCLTAFTHRPLVNPDVSPVIQPLRRIPLALRDDVTHELGSLLEMGIIEQAVIPDRYPLPTSEELTALFYGSTVFTKLDLRQGYLQVPLHPASRDLTAFVMHAGVFRYTRMPFGLRSAPSCFQKVMSTILAGIPGVAVFLDDIVVHAPDLETHKKRLQGVAQALLENNLTLNGEKCCFAVPAIDFVGFVSRLRGLPLCSRTLKPPTGSQSRLQPPRWPRF